VPCSGNVPCSWEDREKTRDGSIVKIRTAAMPGEIVACHRFTEEDQEQFASFSGDRNPMHMDAGAARRTQAGACAVHGVGALLWSLEALEGVAPLPRLTALRADFHRFIPVGASATLVITDSAPDRLRAEIRCDGTRATRVDLTFGDLPASPEPRSDSSTPVMIPPDPRDHDFAEAKAAAGSVLPVDNAAGLARALYPRLSTAIGDDRVAAIGLTSALVGMIMPGLHSIFSGIELNLVRPSSAPRGLAYQVVNADGRFRLLTTSVEASGMVGTLRSFVRFPPVKPPALAQLATQVEPDEFASRRALVIGGSRGLGAVTAKLLAAGGASLAITYHTGRTEAEVIRDDIARTCGTERVSMLRYDAMCEPEPQLAPLPTDFTHVYYCATIPIQGSGRKVYDRSLLDRFLAIYVDGFQKLLTHLRSTAPNEALQAFYPSSVFVEERPSQLTEYAMAKAAGEVLAADLARVDGKLSISTPRLPRVLTDQTATVPPVPSSDPVDIMLPLLREQGE